jgi:hypothetical protein
MNQPPKKKWEFLDDEELQERLENLYLEIGALVQSGKCPIGDALYSIVLFSIPEEDLKRFKKDEVTGQVAVRLLLHTIDTLLTFVPNWSVKQLIKSFELCLENWPSPQVQKELKELKASSVEEGEEWKNAE